MGTITVLGQKSAFLQGLIHVGLDKVSGVLASKPAASMERRYSDKARFHIARKIYDTSYKALSDDSDIQRFMNNAASRDLRAVTGLLSDMIHNDYYEALQLLENISKDRDEADFELEYSDIIDGRYKRAIQDYIDWGYQNADRVRDEIKGWKGRDHKSKLCYLRGLGGRRSMIEDQALKSQMDEQLQTQFSESAEE